MLVGLALVGLFVAIGVWWSVGFGWDRWLEARVADWRSPTVTAVVLVANRVLAPWLGWVAAGALAVRAGAGRLVGASWRLVAWRACWLVGFVAVWRGLVATKGLFDRPRPPAGRALVAVGGWSYPSGHVTAVAVVAGLLVVTAWWAGRRRVAAVVVAGVVVCAAGFDRVYLGVHWPRDVVGAVVAVAGVVVLLACRTGPGS